jgi:pentatricopeptide repeat domain-containing protein 1
LTSIPQQNQPKTSSTTAPPRLHKRQSSPPPPPDPRLNALTLCLLSSPSIKSTADILLNQPITISKDDVRKLIGAMQHHKAPTAALRLYKAIMSHPPLKTTCWKPNDVILWTKLIKLLGFKSSYKYITAALQVYDDMLQSGARPDVVTFNTAITVCVRGRHWDKVGRIYNDMNRLGVNPDQFTYSSLLTACAAMGKCDQALEWFKEIETNCGMSPTVIHYTNLMSALQNSGRWEDSIKIYRQMETDGVSADVVAHNTAITACARGGDWEQAWAVFASMKRAGVAPTAVSYNSLISACEKCGQADRALEIFTKMKAATITSGSVVLDQQGGGGGKTTTAVQPTAVTYNTVISALAKAGQWEQANTIHNEMVEKGMRDDAFTLTALITACEKTGQWEKILPLLDQFIKQGVEPNVVVYNRIITALGNCGQWRMSLAVFEMLKNRLQQHGRGQDEEEDRENTSSTSTTPAILVAGKKVEPYFEETILKSISKAISSLPPVHPDIITFGSLISTLERGGQWKKALEVYNEMVNIAGMKPNGYIFTSLINACEMGGQWEAAREVFLAMREADIGGNDSAMVTRKILYAFPNLASLVPPPFVKAATAAVASGQAARQWIDGTKK